LKLEKTVALLEIMQQLRHPDTGCPWDLKQDFATLTPYIVEEAYEVVDAIERGDYADLRAELGDLLLQVVFQAQIAKEQGLFDFEQVASTIAEKLIRRHPHVFADVKFADDAARQQAWENEKLKEKQQKSNETLESVLHDIPGNLPALLFSEKLQNRAAHYGFDWPEVTPVFDKVLEELDEIKEAYSSGDQAHIQEEVGDLLFVVVNLARHLGVNSEVALKASSRKFSQRFQYIEQQVAASNRELMACELAELDALWHEAKQKLKQ
jgi:nucleoside triphosphate diphosphatase